MADKNKKSGEKGMKMLHALLLLFIFVFGVRLVIAYATPHFSDDYSYFMLRQAEHIASNGIPEFDDPYSFRGKTSAFLPGFPYVMAVFTPLLSPVHAGKIIPNIFAAFTAVLGYLIGLHLTNNKKAALFGGIAAAFTPIHFMLTVNAVTPYSLMATLFLLMIYLYFKTLHNSSYALPLILTFILSSLTHPSTVLFLLGAATHLLILKLDNLRVKAAEIELLVFSSLLYLWLMLLFFKKPLLTLGSSIVWMNLPQGILSQLFPKVTILSALSLIGFVSFIAGLIVVHRHFFLFKDKCIYFIASTIMSITILIIFRLLEFRTGLLYIALCFSLLVPESYRLFERYMRKTPFQKHLPLATAGIVVLLLVGQVLPSIVFGIEQNKEAPTIAEVGAFTWIQENTSPDSIILGTIREGHKIAYLSQRKNVIDSDFLTVKDTRDVFRDVNRMYTTAIRSNAIDLLNEYKVDYIVFSSEAEKIYGINQLPYIQSDCFELVYFNETRIYASHCIIEEKSDQI